MLKKGNLVTNFNISNFFAAVVVALAFPLYSQTPDAFNPGPSVIAGGLVTL